MKPEVSGSKFTLKKLAELVGTTPNTISRALNDKDGVSETTRERIKGVAAKYNYRRDQLARSMRVKYTNLIGFLVEDVTNPFFIQMLAGAEKQVTQYGKTLLIGTSDERQENERKHIDTFLSYRCSGMALCLVSPDDMTIDFLNAERATYIILDAPFEKHLTCDHICIDYRAESAKIVNYLIGCGHRKIAYISPELLTETEVARFDGFKSELIRHGCVLIEEITRFCIDEGEAYRETLELIRSDADFTAIYVAKSTFGLGVISALVSEGKRVPEDMSLAMFGHNDWADIFQPRITCLKRPVYEMGKLGIQCLEERIRYQGIKDPLRIVLNAQLRVGDSVARI